MLCEDTPLWDFWFWVFDQKPPNNSGSLRQRTFVRWVVGGKGGPMHITSIRLKYNYYEHCHVMTPPWLQQPKFLWQLENIFDNTSYLSISLYAIATRGLHWITRIAFKTWCFCMCIAKWRCKFSTLCLHTRIHAGIQYFLKENVFKLIFHILP